MRRQCPRWRPHCRLSGITSATSLPMFSQFPLGSDTAQPRMCHDRQWRFALGVGDGLVQYRFSLLLLSNGVEKLFGKRSADVASHDVPAWERLYWDRRKHAREFWLSQVTPNAIALRQSRRLSPLVTGGRSRLRRAAAIPHLNRHSDRSGVAKLDVAALGVILVGTRTTPGVLMCRQRHRVVRILILKLRSAGQQRDHAIPWGNEIRFNNLVDNRRA